MLITDDRTGLAPYIVMGYVDRQAFPYDAHNPLPLSAGVIGRAARTGQTQVVHRVTTEEDRLPFIPNARTHVSVPLSMRGQALGVITLASVHDIEFGGEVVGFLERLGRRAAVALDNARLYRRTEQLANDMAALYNASRAITSTLNRDEVLRRIARAMTETLECSSSVIFDYKPETHEVQVLAVHRAGADLEGQEVLPPLKHAIPLALYPAFQTVVEQQHSLALRAADLSLSTLDRSHLVEDRIHAMVLVPLVAQDELMGVAAVIEGRYDRVFTANEVYKAEALASQAAIALRQSLLFSEIKELETLKSEMIRMASHDLRNPLNNVMGYAELLAMSLDELGCLTPTQQMYLQNLRASAEIMKTLLEDLLTLERIESERQAEWETFDFGGLVIEVVESQQASAALKQQTLRLVHEAGTLPVHGSTTQLRQAVANLVSNAIKYTPQGGHIDVSAGLEEGDRVAFQVTDDGYGISPERQARIFERFYRAREPGTEHIGGTGLGLSLVKTVVERHGGAGVVQQHARQGEYVWLLVASGRKAPCEGLEPQGGQGYSRTEGTSWSLNTIDQHDCWGGESCIRQPNGEFEKASVEQIGIKYVAGGAATLFERQFKATGKALPDKEMSRQSGPARIRDQNQCSRAVDDDAPLTRSKGKCGGSAF